MTLADPNSAAEMAQLLAAAEAAAAQAYAPYSGFRVGAALLVEGGDIITGANVENASYGLSLCAERCAVARAVAGHGPQMRLVAAAVTNLNDADCSPCGACRQVLAEFMPGAARLYFPFGGRPVATTLAAVFPLGFDLSHGR